VKLLISGRKGKLYNAAAEAFSAREGYSTDMVPAGPQLLEMARFGSYAAVLYVLGNERDLEPVRWLLQDNPALRLVAVIQGGNPKLRKELQAEGVSQVIEVGDVSAAAIRRRVHEQVEAFLGKPTETLTDDIHITTDLHGIRSALTAIQAFAEQALTKVRGPDSKKRLQGIVREVTEVEGRLRRIERKVNPRGPLPPK